MAEERVRADEGRIEAIEMCRVSESKSLSAGAVVGSIAGGVIGHQIGSSRGNTAAKSPALLAALSSRTNREEQTQTATFR